MNQNLKTALIVLGVLVLFKVIDRLFLDSVISQVLPANYETEE